MSKHFNSEVKKGLTDIGMSMRELARKSGLDISFLSKILSGKRNPPSKEKDIRNIASALGIKEEKLIFAAGRIPRKLIPAFKDPEIIDLLLSGNFKDKIAKKKKKKKKTKIPKKDNQKPLFSGREIDDTIL